MTLQNMKNIHYDATIYFGSEKQPLRVLIDTGSS